MTSLVQTMIGTQLGHYTISNNVLRGSNRGDRSIAINIHDNVEDVRIDNNSFYIHDDRDSVR